MLLAEKITTLRKKQGWSQEELAQVLDVSRQSVSKWESGVSVPDIEKILKLSDVFGVSTDYLLKNIESDSEANLKQTFAEKSEKLVSAATANDFINTTIKHSARIAAGVFLCIISPVPIVFSRGLFEFGKSIAVSGAAATGIGVISLFLLIAAAVALFIFSGLKLDKFEYLKKEIFTLEASVREKISVQKEEYEKVFRNSITAGVFLCIISVIPIMLSAAAEASDFAVICCVCLLFLFAGIGVFLIVKTSMVHGCFKKLLQEGDYTPENKNKAKKNDAFAGAYWCFVTAVYLGVSFFSSRWDITWVIWPVAGLLFAGIESIISAASKK